MQKKMRINRVLIILCCFIFFGCKTDTKSIEVIKKEFHDNGNLRLIYFGDTLAKGKAYHFYPEGEKFTEINYKGSKIEGVYKYYSNGKLSLEEFYVDGMKNGYSKNYDSIGRVFEEGEYKDDLEHGVWNYYHNNKLILSEIYNKGVLKEVVYKDTTEVSTRSR